MDKLCKKCLQFPVTRVGRGTAVLYLRNGASACLLADSHVNEPNSSLLIEEDKLRRLTASANFWVAASGSVKDGDKMIGELIKRLSSCNITNGGLDDIEDAMRESLRDESVWSTLPMDLFGLLVMDNTTGVAQLFQVAPNRYLDVGSGNLLWDGCGGQTALRKLTEILRDRTCLIKDLPRGTTPEHISQHYEHVESVEMVGARSARVTFHRVENACDFLESERPTFRGRAVRVLNELVLPQGNELLITGLEAMQRTVYELADSPSCPCDEPVLARTINIPLTATEIARVEGDFDSGAYGGRGMEVRVNRETESWEEFQRRSTEEY